MAFLGTEGEMISRNDAKKLIDNYQISPAFLANNQTEGFLYGKDHLNLILSQQGCTGIRIYYGKDGVINTDPARMVLVGTDSDGNDMSTGLILDTGAPCPTLCSSPSTKL